MTDGNQTTTPATGEVTLSGQPVVILEGLELQPGTPFFEFMLTFLVATAGLTPTYDAANYPNFMQGTDGVYPGRASGNLQANLWRPVGYVRAGHLPQRSAEISLCCMLATAAFQSLDKSTVDRFKDKNNALDVLRHIRNAASHGNKWHFEGSQPKVRCEWGTLVIDQATPGAQHPLHGQQCLYGSLGPADLLRLIRDVEKLIAPP
jgi:hypothetical protein